MTSLSVTNIKPKITIISNSIFPRPIKLEYEHFKNLGDNFLRADHTGRNPLKHFYKICNENVKPPNKCVKENPDSIFSKPFPFPIKLERVGFAFDPNHDAHIDFSVSVDQKLYPKLIRKSYTSFSHLSTKLGQANRTLLINLNQAVHTNKSELANLRLNPRVCLKRIKLTGNTLKEETLCRIKNGVQFPSQLKRVGCRITTNLNQDDHVHPVCLKEVNVVGANQTNKRLNFIKLEQAEIEFNRIIRSVPVDPNLNPIVRIKRLKLIQTASTKIFKERENMVSLPRKNLKHGVGSVCPFNRDSFVNHSVLFKLNLNPIIRLKRIKIIEEMQKKRALNAKDNKVPLPNKLKRFSGPNFKQKICAISAVPSDRNYNPKVRLKKIRLVEEKTQNISNKIMKPSPMSNVKLKLTNCMLGHRYNEDVDHVFSDQNFNPTVRINRMKLTESLRENMKTGLKANNFEDASCFIGHNSNRDDLVNNSVFADQNIKTQNRKKIIQKTSPNIKLKQSIEKTDIKNTPSKTKMIVPSSKIWVKPINCMLRPSLTQEAHVNRCALPERYINPKVRIRRMKLINCLQSDKTRIERKKFGVATMFRKNVFKS